MNIIRFRKFLATKISSDQGSFAGRIDLKTFANQFGEKFLFAFAFRNHRKITFQGSRRAADGDHDFVSRSSRRDGDDLIETKRSLIMDLVAVPGAIFVRSDVDIQAVELTSLKKDRGPRVFRGGVLEVTRIDNLVDSALDESSCFTGYG